MIGLFIYVLPKAIKHSNTHKYFLLVGVFFYITFALLALIYSVIAFKENKETNAILFFFIGIIIEGVFFSMGLAYKMKLINDERIKTKNDIIQKNYEIEITKLQALIEGEEKERMRLAQDLHDGINGDLSSIKYQLSSVNENLLSTEVHSVFKKTIDMIDHSCQQIRTISQNLSPVSIRDFGLITSIKNYCSKTESLHPLSITFQHFGNYIQLPKNIETVIYRIVQELVNNIIKHADATEALVQINSYDSNLFITVEDNGKGFQNTKNTSGIGLKNIASRIAFLNAQLEEDHHEKGTTFNINIDLNKIPIT